MSWDLCKEWEDVQATYWEQLHGVITPTQRLIIGKIADYAWGEQALADGEAKQLKNVKRDSDGNLIHKVGQQWLPARVAWIKQDKLMKAAGLTDRGVRKAISKLEADCRCHFRTSRAYLGHAMQYWFPPLDLWKIIAETVENSRYEAEAQRNIQRFNAIVEARDT